MAARALSAKGRLRLPERLCFKEQLRRKIVFASAADELPGILLDAMETQFPDFLIQRVDGVEEICRLPPQQVRLMLVDAGTATRDYLWMSRIKQNHPNSTVAVTFADEEAISETILDLVSLGTVRSVIPMNFRIDVWLAVIRIVLNGAEYYPSIVMRKLCQHVQDQFKTFHRNGAPELDESISEQDSLVDELTPRELEILRLVARGNQNKTIAAALKLSENTVKIHLHNIITKLGVHNRTEAAAKLHEAAGTQPVLRLDSDREGGPEG